MIITISGKPGAGKTSSGKELARILNYKFLSIGDLRGIIAKERGLTIDELNEIGKKESWVHEEADKKTIEIGKKMDNFIVEGWAAYHFIPHSKKIFLHVDEDVGAERVFKDQRYDEERQETVENMKNLQRKRLIRTEEQFRKYYEVDFLDEKNYDIVIDTTSLSQNEIVDELLRRLT
ncbi:MAG: cytidylate kinase family protein [Candidatus Pacearchaeota archaeon]